MNKFLIPILVITFISACKSDNKKEFTVNGKVENTTAKTAYLEEMSIGSQQPVIVDSASVVNGAFSLKTKTTEAAIYNIRLDDGQFPVASVINDNPTVDLKLSLNKENSFTEKYEVKGSPASQQMKDFMFGFGNKIQSLFGKVQQLDSLQTQNAADSVLAPKHAEIETLAGELRTYTLGEIKKSDNPALTMFELGYYQSTANNPATGLQPIANEEVTAIIDDVAKKNPDHVSLAGLRINLKKQMEAGMPAGKWVGKQAPEFTLPDLNGKPVSLSSFKGKFVLVDFWASWCKPCRMENPNVVAAYKKFKDKKFTILGVSLDANKDAWKAAIKKDGLAWSHVSDLKQWESAVIPLYGFDGIPYNVLIDTSGRVIAEGLRGPALDAKLAEVLK